MSSKKFAWFVMVPLTAAAVAGCSSGSKQQPAPSKFDAAGGDAFGTNQSAEFDVGPRDMLQRIEQVLNTAGPKVTQRTKDTLVTDWERHRGDFHIARYWQERTRYRIAVIPDADDPTGRSRVQIDEETQQRAASVQEFEAASYLKRPERATKLLAKIKEQIPPAAPGTARRTTSPQPRAAVQPAPAVTVRPEQAKWTRAGNVELAVLRTDPNTGATQALVRSAGETRLPARALSSGTSFAVITGRAAVGAGADRSELAPGGFTYVPRGSTADVTLGAGTTVLITTDGPWDADWLR